VSELPLDDDLVLYDPGTGLAHILNPTASHIWALCDGLRTTGSMARAISAAFGVERQQALADVHAFVHELREAGLLAEPTSMSDPA
jgi:PqqD family protein of HPr-rel-A system